MLMYSADNVNIGFDLEYAASNFIARHAAVAWLYKVGSKFLLNGSTGNTIGNTAAQNSYFTVDLAQGFTGVGKTTSAGLSPGARLQVEGLVVKKRTSTGNETIPDDYCSVIAKDFTITGTDIITISGTGILQIV
jgi:hypothetical protein